MAVMFPLPYAISFYFGRYLFWQAGQALRVAIALRNRIVHARLLHFDQPMLERLPTECSRF
jgi:hypothetical protein